MGIKQIDDLTVYPGNGPVQKRDRETLEPGSVGIRTTNIHRGGEPTSTPVVNGGVIDETADDERRNERAANGTADYLECEVCHTRVPASVHREHLLKACPGEWTRVLGSSGAHYRAEVCQGELLIFDTRTIFTNT
ncbi:hypothetical protein B1756_06770 [Natrarchaeobaculum aegyptiacum]|uniref:Uncharacterized protein n=1 Tax=Natrarchaeobaculum aegyptiacum TaxID=745377 RepID=A0A2Z2HVC1_9EURY|nr:hypothetical protein B1756_06770 [Natrarchaeobaculum aegyptiacum]